MKNPNIFFALAVILFTFTGYSKPTHSNIKAVTLELAPWGYHHKGEVQGAFWEPMELILKHTKIPYKHQLSPLKRALEGMTTSPLYDLALFTPGPHSKDLIDLGTISSQVKLIAIPRAGIELKSLKDLKSLKIGTPRGISANTEALNPKTHSITYVSDNTHGLKMLINKRFDVYIETNVSISGVAEMLNLEPKNFSKPLVLIGNESFHAHVWLNKKSELTKGSINTIKQSIHSLKKSGKFKPIFDRKLKWFQKLK